MPTEIHDDQTLEASVSETLEEVRRAAIDGVPAETAPSALPKTVPYSGVGYYSAPNSERTETFKIVDSTEPINDISPPAGRERGDIPVN